MKEKLKAIPEYERDMYANNIIIALHALLNSPLDDIANDLMDQIKDHSEGGGKLPDHTGAEGILKVFKDTKA